MKQQINLYHHEEKTTVPFSSGACALILLVSVAVLSAVYAYNEYRLSQLETEYAVLKKEQKKLQNQFEQARSSIKDIKESPKLKADVLKLDREIAAKKKFETLLDGLEPEQRVPFSSLLTGLSDRAVDGLWLTRIQSDTGMRSMNLEGGTLKADLVTDYIKRLGEAQGYHQARFDEFQLEQKDREFDFKVTAWLTHGGGS